MTVSTEAPARTADYAIDPDIVTRWSPRAFDASSLDETLLLNAFEAARWAPSAFNYQPWHFAYELREGPLWEEFLSILLPFNAGWAQSASALVFVISDKVMAFPGKEPNPNGSHSFDAGAAWGLFALQAHKLGLHTHAMAGFDHARAAEVLGLSDRWHVNAAVAVGRIGSADQLDEGLRSREFPSPRRPVAESAVRGKLDI